MQPKVTKIPATKPRYNTSVSGIYSKKRVAGYARVSTDKDEQFSSYEAQIDYYTNFIKAHLDWEFVEVYTDEGITGTSTKHRDGFKRMIKDALDGKIDLIVTKSVSRFARNTVDSLQTVRALKEKGVEIFFEKENIWTLDAKGELLITIMSSLAQEESRSISENTTWGKRKKFADGKYSVPFKVFLGYDRGPDGELVINEEQAKVVRQIYGLFLDGYNPPEIARRLEEQNILSPAGCKHWSNTTVASILRNEKYKGDALLQKQYTDDFLSKKLINNKGEVQQYYVTGGHPAIISPDEFDYVQKIFPERMKNYPRNNDVFAKKLVCPDCGGYLGRKVWHSVDKYRTYRYTCNNRYSGCSFNKSIKPEDIEKAFVSKLNMLIMQRGELIEEFKTIVTTVLDTTALEEKEKTLREEVTKLAKELNYRVEKNASHAQNQYIYRREFVQLEGEYAKATKELNEVVTELEEKRARKFISTEFFSELEKCKEPIKEFNPKLWIRLVDRAVVKVPDDIRIRFKNGIEI